MIKLLIADDHSFFAQGVMMSLKNTDINVLGHISSAEEIVEAYQKFKPDVLLCDITFGQAMNGFDALRKLLEIDPDGKVILLSQYDQDKMIKESYKIGAKAFLSKSIVGDDLIEAIRCVATGELYFTPENAIKLAKMSFDKSADERTLDEILSGKEIEVLKLLSDGYTEKEVASNLALSVKTIANLKASIKEKLNIERNTSLTKIALKHGLIGWDNE